MDQAKALRHLRKALGAKMGYRVDPKALAGDERLAAIEKGKALREQKDAKEALLTARRAEILKADAEYQKLATEVKALNAQVDRLLSHAHVRRVTVGINGGIFFSVRAEGDNWDEVVRKVVDKAT